MKRKVKMVRKVKGHKKYIPALKREVTFCNDCGEYIDKHGICSNPACPEQIN